MHLKAEREFDRQAAAFLDELGTLALAVIVALLFGWFIGAWLAG